MSASEHPMREHLLGEAARAILDSRSRTLARDEKKPFRPALATELTALDGEELHRLAAGRRSVRHFTTDPLALTDVLRICRVATEACGLLSSSGPPAHRATWLVSASRVEGVEPALYAYEGDGLHRVGELVDPRVLTYAGQPRLITAPCVLHPRWDLAEAMTSHPTDGYLNVLTTAGGALYSAWLFALTLNLSGCLFRGANPALLPGSGPGGPAAHPVLALALGHEAS
ncbi:nitroreductase family protein [Streptomyces griseus]|uniref:hypothetical protein n=1 Tax=Streptomyces griseus TaxID=1911 RepID=UPI00386F4FA6|nr:nitroreductase family protein [Streptomyces fimicarius]